MEKSAACAIPKRDFIILPLISLLSVLVPLALAESIARLIWVESTQDDCLYFDALGQRHKPLCSSLMKNIEGHWVRYEFNACGYRGTQSCGPKPPGTSRFVIMGTSVAYGLNVPEEELFTERAAPELGRILGRAVQFENIGSVGPDLQHQYEMVNEVRNLQPDAVFLLLDPYDLKRFAAPSGPNPPAGRRSKLPRLSELAYLARSSRLFFMAQHFLLEDQEFAERAFLMNDNLDDAARLPPTALTQQRFERLGILLRRLTGDLRDHGIPLFVIPLPSRLHAVLISRHTELPGVDPSAFPRRVDEIAHGAGAQTIDVIPELKRAPVVDGMYYAVDGHLTGAGHRIVAQSVVDYFKRRGPAALSNAPPAISGGE